MYNIYVCTNVRICISLTLGGFSKTGRNIGYLSAATVLADCGNKRVPGVGLFAPSSPPVIGRSVTTGADKSETSVKV